MVGSRGMGRDPERGGMGFSRSGATIRALVRRSVGPYVCNAFAFRPTKIDLWRVYCLVISCTKVVVTSLGPDQPLQSFNALHCFLTPQPLVELFQVPIEPFSAICTQIRRPTRVHRKPSLLLERERMVEVSLPGGCYI